MKESRASVYPLIFSFHYLIVVSEFPLPTSRAEVLRWSVFVDYVKWYGVAMRIIRYP